MIGTLKSGAWGFARAKPGAPEWLGLSPVIWLVLGGGVVVALFVMWVEPADRHGQAALIDLKMLRNIQLRDGVTSFFFLFLVQAGIFFVVPLFLSVALGLSAVATGLHLLPLSLMLLLFAAGVPRCSRTQTRDGSSASASSQCSVASCCFSSCSTTALERRSSPGRSAGAPGSARSPRN